MTFHDGELEIQRRAGVADKAARIGHVLRQEIPTLAQGFLLAQPWIVLGAADADGRHWATILQSTPGFARARDARTVILDAEIPFDDPLAGSLVLGAEVGLLAIELATRKRIRVNGRVAALDPLTLTTDQVYSNCPKYIQARCITGELKMQPSVAERALTLRSQDRERIQTADTFFIASGVAGEGADASHRGGRPGFVKVEDNRLSWPDYSGNMMFNTLGNLTRNPAAGLLFVDFERGDLLHLTGRARIDWSDQRSAAEPGAGRMIDLDVDSILCRSGALRLRFSEGEASPFNP